jgi:hypothetical protein
MGDRGGMQSVEVFLVRLFQVFFIGGFVFTAIILMIIGTAVETEVQSTPENHFLASVVPENLFSRNYLPEELRWNVSEKISFNR